MNVTQQPAQNLHRLLAAEDKKKRDVARNASSRHSRFGTTIAVRLNSTKKAGVDRSGDNAGSSVSAGASERGSSSRPLVLHRQAAITQESGSILDITKHQKARKANKVDELTREDSLSFEARLVLQGFAREFVESCFNRAFGGFLSWCGAHVVVAFLSSLLKDIKSERPKITEKDHLRLLYTTKWLLEFFLNLRSKESIVGGHRKWNIRLVAEVTDRSWIVWVLRRMREAVEDKVCNFISKLIGGVPVVLLFLAQDVERIASGYRMSNTTPSLDRQHVFIGYLRSGSQRRRAAASATTNL